MHDMSRRLAGEAKAKKTAAVRTRNERERAANAVVREQLVFVLAVLIVADVEAARNDLRHGGDANVVPRGFVVIRYGSVPG